MKISKEGYGTIGIAALLVLGIIAICYLFAPLIVTYIVGFILVVHFGLVLWFFRVPSRPTLQDESLVYAPADGKVVVIEEIEEMEYLGELVKQVSIFMSITSVHVNWYPVGGKVEYFKHHPGKFLVAWHPKSSEENERTTTVVNTGKCKILFRQVAGYLARRIVSYVEEQKEVMQNQKCGFIKFGSRMDIMLPLDAEILVELGDKVRGSLTPIARLK